MFCCSCKNLSRSYALLKVGKSDQRKSHSLRSWLFGALAWDRFKNVAWNVFRMKLLKTRRDGSFANMFVGASLFQNLIELKSRVCFLFQLYPVSTFYRVTAALKSTGAKSYPFKSLFHFIQGGAEELLFGSAGQDVTIAALILCLLSSQRSLPTLTLLTKISIDHLLVSLLFLPHRGWRSRVYVSVWEWLSKGG